MKFCKKVLDMKLRGKDIFFTDECIMDCNPFVNEKNQIVKRKYREIKKRRY